MTTLNFDFTNLPSDVALALSRQQHTRLLVNDLAGAMRLSEEDRDALHQEMVGTIAELVDKYLDHATKPKS